MEWRPSILGLSCRIGAALEQQLGELHITLVGRPMERRPPVLGLGSQVSAVLEQEPDDFDVTLS
jgi:hypothetical protein